MLPVLPEADLQQLAEEVAAEQYATHSAESGFPFAPKWEDLPKRLQAPLIARVRRLIDGVIAKANKGRA